MSEIYDVSHELSIAKETLTAALAKQLVQACKHENADDLTPVFSALAEHNIDAISIIRAIKLRFDEPTNRPDKENS